MDEFLFKSIEEIKTFFNKCVITLSSFLFVGLIQTLNNKYHNAVPENMKFLELEIYPEYFSLMFGILVFVFIFVLYFKFMELREITEEIDMQDEAVYKKIRFVHWIASPFNKSKTGLYFFAIPLVILVVWLGKLGIAHLFFSMPGASEIELGLYKIIGIVDIIFFIISTYAVFSIGKQVLEMRKKIQVGGLS